MVMRGYVGSPRMRKKGFPFVDERLLRERLAGGTTLKELTKWCEEMAYLPSEGGDFSMYRTEVESRSGIRIITYEGTFRE